VAMIEPVVIDLTKESIPRKVGAIDRMPSRLAH